MTPYQLRVVDEERELSMKIAGLHKFLQIPRVWETTGTGEHVRLTRQHTHMVAYRDILRERIAFFGSN